MDTRTLETVQNFQASHMGVYEHVGRVASRVRLRELVTDDEFECHVAAGYRGKAGELWYVRRCLPLRDLCNYHLIFTTPYVLTETSKADWTAYLNKAILETGRTDRRTALHQVLKYGREPQFWSEFIVLGYHHHQPDAIFLAGLPDVKGSGSCWIPGSYLTSNSMSACSNAFPRFLALCTNSKKPRERGSFSCEMPLWGRSQLRKTDQNPSMVLTWTSQKPRHLHLWRTRLVHG
jgi:hypothetical protein